MNPSGNIAKPATADSSKDKPGAVTSLPKNDKSELKTDNKGPDLSKGFPPLPPSAGLGAVSGSSTGILGTAPPAPSGMPALEGGAAHLRGQIGRGHDVLDGDRAAVDRRERFAGAIDFDADDHFEHGDGVL